MGGQPISDHVMLLGSLLGDQGFQRAPKELLVALGSPARTDIDPEPRARLDALALWGLMDSEIGIYWGGLAQQIQEGL
jgi:hypothetical protein